MFAACPGFPSNTFSVIFSTPSLVILCFNPYTELSYICIENKNLPELWSGIVILALASSTQLAEGVNFCTSRYNKSDFRNIMISL